MEAHGKILIVEDEGLVAQELESVLSEAGLDVVGLEMDAKGAIKKAESARPDLVLMDVRIRGKRDGIETAKVIRKRFGIPTIYLSAYADENTLKRAQATKPYGYLVKPFRGPELLTCLEMALYRCKADSELNGYRTRLDELVRERTISLETLRLALEVSGQATWDFDVRADEAMEGSEFAAMLGYTREESTESRISFSNRLHPDDRNRVFDAFDKCIQQTFPQFEAEFRLLTKSRAWKWVYSIGRVVERDAAGHPLRLIGINMDIDRRKTAEEKLRNSLHEKEVLLKEIHHRVKNNLQVVSSLLQIQARHIADPATRQAFLENRDRVRSMALIHERLYRSSDFAHIDFSRYVTELVTSLCSAHGSAAAHVSFLTEIPPMNLNVNLAVPCGLIINELVINCLKHAFPDNRKGQVVVAMRPETKDRIALRVRDDGVGLRDEINLRKPDTMGMTIVTALVKQLRGQIEIDATDGVDVRIEFPAGQ